MVTCSPSSWLLFHLKAAEVAIYDTDALSLQQNIHVKNKLVVKEAVLRGDRQVPCSR